MLFNIQLAIYKNIQYSNDFYLFFLYAKSSVKRLVW